MSTSYPQRKLGRRPPKNAPALRLATFLTGIIPDHPTSEDYLNKLQNWKMLGNDQYGDCVAVTWANTRRFVTAWLSTEDYPGMDQVIALYKTQNPNFPSQDDGMDIQTCLEYLHNTGGPDGVKAVAFAKVDYTNLDEVKAALAVFGSVWLGVNVLKANMTEFDNGQPWDYVPGSPDDGGHSVISGGYLGASTDDVRFITWAQETGFTDNFWNKQVEEAWVVIWPEHLGTVEFQQGVNLQQLAADYKELTGSDLPLTPTPSNPTPQPTPTPSSPGCLAGLWNKILGLFQ
ncbi:MAG TPA: hypothetical protein VMT73_02620 [Anaerolineales bacterium]|nr:hypothetical protein [Anaerolineales bacterium]